MKAKKEIAYQYFYCGCIGILIFILIFTFNHVGIYYILGIIFGLIAIPYITWVLKRIFTAWIINKKWNVKKKVMSQLIIGIFLFYIWFIIDRFFSHISIFFHEVGHILTALSFNVRIQGVLFLPLEGKTFMNLSDLESLTVMEHTIVAASGGCGVILIGILILLLIHWNENISLIYRTPLYLIITTAVCSDLYYFGNGALTLTNDMGVIIQLNPGLFPEFIAFISFFLMILVPIFMIWSLFKRTIELSTHNEEVL